MKNRVRNSRHWFSVVAVTASMFGCGISDMLQGEASVVGMDGRSKDLASRRGGIQMNYGALQKFKTAMGIVFEDVGVFTDELGVYDGTVNHMDARYTSGNLPGIRTSGYQALQTARIHASQTVDILSRYGDESSRRVLGHAYALEAHTILQMAEMFCSGVPLTDVPFLGNIQYSPAISTTALFERAVALFDSAYLYGHDSLPIATFAQVGKGRALLGLGRYADASNAVATVPTSAQYALDYSTGANGVPLRDLYTTKNTYVVYDTEGQNGIRWSAPAGQPSDLRVPLTVVSGTMYRQRKFTSQTGRVVLADGIQARMIEAEAALQPANAPSGDWLTKLNAARAMQSLDPLTDPGSAEARINLLFKERAFSFYLTGARLGDMRRLVRNYSYPVNSVYAVGMYPKANLIFQSYGEAVVFVLDNSESDLNPLYRGCINTLP